MEPQKHIFLMGRPPMGEALGFLKYSPVEPITDLKKISDEWRKANDHVKKLMEKEKKTCDKIKITPIDTKYEEKINKIIQSPIFQKSYSILPTEFKMVELDKLVVYQKTVNLGFVEFLKNGFPKEPDDDFLFDFCLGPRANPPVNVTRINQNIIQYSSISNDFRFLEGEPLDVEKMRWYTAEGLVTDTVGLFLGYGSNFVNAFKVGERIILNNGMHRAYVLKDMGFNHMPCILQQISRKEEFNVTTFGKFSEEVLKDLTESSRPSLLKDFFDPNLMKEVMLPAKIRTVRVGWNVEQVDSSLGI